MMRFLQWLGSLFSQKKQMEIIDEPSPPSSNQTTGERNNNPLNVKSFGTNWKGMDSVDSRNHAIFESVPYGLRAGIITLRTYWFSHNLRTVSGILSRWAPVTDTIGSIPGAPPNSPVAYSKFVSNKMGVTPNATLDLFNSDRSIRNDDQLFALVSAIAEYENYAGYQIDPKDYGKASSLV